MSKEYEVTQMIFIPASVIVEADTPQKAAEIGLALLEETGGEQGEQFWDNSVRVWERPNDGFPVLEYEW